MLIFYCIICVFHLSFGNFVPCMQRKYDSGIVCVCNSTYCDTVLTNLPVPYQSVSIYTSTEDGQRFNLSIKHVSNTTYKDNNRVIIDVNDQQRYQTLTGFGGAATDAATINILSLSKKTQEELLKTYFSNTGIEYNMIRVPIASCDYSTRQYTYLDTPNDFNLTTFGLAKEDIVYKIPVITQILKMASKEILFFGSPWSAPAWMKTNGNLIGRGSLKGQAGDKYHKTWAKYFTRFFDEYSKFGIKFWGVTAQNEPSNGELVSSKWQGTGFTANSQRDFIKLDLGPTLVKDGYKDVKLMILDDQRLFLPSFPNTVLSDPEAKKYVSGVGVHWYWNWLVGPKCLSDTHNNFPDTFILATEACNKDTPGPNLGDWKNGEKYSNDVLDNLNNWSVGWIDWNMVLNLQGGPNWAHNYDDSPIIVNATADEFYKQPMYYHLGHFSKFLPQGSYRISSLAQKSSALKFVAAKNDNQYILVILNQSKDTTPVTVVTNSQYSFNVTIGPSSIQTFSWSL